MDRQNSGNLGFVFAPLSLLIFISATFVLGWATIFALRDRAVILKQLWAGAVVEGLLLIQVLTAAISLLRTPRDNFEAWEFWGYFITILIILPGAALWAFAERSRWSSVVLAVASFTVIFLQFRLIQLWG